MRISLGWAIDRYFGRRPPKSRASSPATPWAEQSIDLSAADLRNQEHLLPQPQSGDRRGLHHRPRLRPLLPSGRRRPHCRRPLAQDRLQHRLLPRPQSGDRRGLRPRLRPPLPSGRRRPHCRRPLPQDRLRHRLLPRPRSGDRRGLHHRPRLRPPLPFGRRRPHCRRQQAQYRLQHPLLPLRYTPRRLSLSPTTSPQDRPQHIFVHGLHQRLRPACRSSSSNLMTTPTFFPASSTSRTRTGRVNSASSPYAPPPSASLP